MLPTSPAAGALTSPLIMVSLPVPPSQASALPQAPSVGLVAVMSPVISGQALAGETCGKPMVKVMSATRITYRRVFITPIPPDRASVKITLTIYIIWRIDKMKLYEDGSHFHSHRA